jgi:hypothetical protein
MKIKLEQHLDDHGFETGEWYETGDVTTAPVEVPDAIVLEWRACLARIVEIEKYFDERVKPEIDKAEDEKRKQYWQARPERAEMDDMLAEMMRRNYEVQLGCVPPGTWLHTEDNMLVGQTVGGDVIRYDLTAPVPISAWTKKDSDGTSD